MNATTKTTADLLAARDFFTACNARAAIAGDNNARITLARAVAEIQTELDIRRELIAVFRAFTAFTAWSAA